MCYKRLYCINFCLGVFQAPDFGAELTNGCHGFATKYMHWNEELIVGGVRKNQTGHIVRAEALQSVILLMGEATMFEYWNENYKTLNIDWDKDKARAILEAWHRKFTEVGTSLLSISSNAISRFSKG